MKGQLALKSKRWVIATPVPQGHLAQFTSLPPLLVQLLYNRGVRTPASAEEFLRPESMAANPFQLAGMHVAVARLRQAIRQQEPIAIYGDYDVDGVTATALLVETLKALGGRAYPYIPHRVEEGYGLNMTAMQRLTRSAAKLVVTVDCGVRSVEEVAYARKLGIEMIITDHHAVGPTLPPAIAIINPKQPGRKYPFDELAGVGLAFKLAQALLLVENKVPLGKALSSSLPDEESLLDLVALGTVADIVPLLGENRALVRRGLRQLNEAKRPGVRAMLEEAGMTAGGINAYTIGYILGPRLNAAGRLADAIASYNLLVASSLEEAQPLAKELGERNRERQRLTEELVARAEAEVLSEGIGPLLIVAGREYLAGVAGLIASRLAEEFYRPAVVIEIGEETSKGSARSIPEFHITQALDGCADLLLKHGGHAAAAGFTLKNEHLAEFKARLGQIAAGLLRGVELIPQLAIDAEIPLSRADWATAAMIEQLEPFGHKNPEPVFVSRNVAVREHRLVKEKHLGLVLSDGRIVWDAIAFGQGAWAGQVPPRVDVAYSLSTKERGGQKQLNLVVKDLRPAEAVGERGDCCRSI